MVQSKRITRLLVLSIFFSFMVWSISSFILTYSLGLENLLNQTFLKSAMFIISKVITVTFISLNFLSKIFFVGATVSLFVVFYQDYIKNTTVR